MIRRLTSLLVVAMMLSACSGGGETASTGATISTTTTDATVTVETTAAPDTAADIPEGHSTVGFVDLPIGSCFSALDVDLMQTAFDADVDVVDCNWSHEAEVYASYSFDAAAEFPGVNEAREVVATHCDETFEDYVGNPITFSSLFVWPILPTRAEWDAGSRTAVCVLIDFNGDDLRGSAWRQGW